MSTSQVSICNMALAYIQQDPITALSDSNDRARRCNLLYEATRDEVLRAHDWTFASKSVALSVLANSELESGWDYLYGTPAQCLFVQRVFITSDPKTPQPFERLTSPTTAVDSIATNAATAYARCTMRITDPLRFDPNFVESLALLLSAKLAIPLTGDKDLAKEQIGMYQQALDQARTTNQSEGYDDQTRPASSYEGSR